MSRSTRRRTSRAVAVALVLMLVAGIVFAVSKFRETDENASPTPDTLAARDQGRASPATADPSHPAPPPQNTAMMPLLAATANQDMPLIRTETPVLGSADSTLPSAMVMPTSDPVVAAATIATPSAIPPAVTAAPVTLSGDPMVDGQAHLDAGDPIGARKVLNDALVNGQFGESDALTAKDLLSKINREAVFGRKAFKDDALCELYTVRPGGVLQKIAAENSTTWELLCRINGISDPRRLRAGQTIKVVKGPFHAVVSKSTFVMDIYLGAPGGAGATYVMSFPVGLGKDDSTPIGTWLVDPHKKLKNPTYFSPRGEGIIAADDPKNPLGEYWIGLAGVEGQAVGKQSYGIHGTIEPESIGKQESMGCIRLRNEDVALVFELLVEGKSQVMVKE